LIVTTDTSVGGGADAFVSDLPQPAMAELNRRTVQARDKREGEGIDISHSEVKYGAGTADCMKQQRSGRIRHAPLLLVL
jgi:hypothetical protein